MGSPLLETAVTLRENIEKKINSLQKTIISSKTDLKIEEELLYQAILQETHIKEIYRLARCHFPRLQKNPDLTDTDILEIDKWIRRCKSFEGYTDIVNALKELEKYTHADIRQNLYALVQKIIIGGAYKEKQKG